MVPFASVGVVDWIVLAFFVGFLPVGWWVVWRMWRYGDLREQPRNPYSSAQRDRMRRVMPAAVVASTALAIAFAVGAVLGQHTLADNLAIGVFGVIFFVAGGVAMSVDLRDKPNWAIAPVLRDKKRVVDNSVGPFGALVLFAARRRRHTGHRDDRRRDPISTPSRGDDSDEWLDPDTKQWLERRMREKQP